jgi:hypothetical protein
MTTGVYTEAIRVVRIGQSLYMTIPYGNGWKRIYLAEEEMLSLRDKITATLTSPIPNNINGEALAHATKRPNRG